MSNCCTRIIQVTAGGAVVDTFATVDTAVGVGIDSFGNAIAIGEQVITFSSGQTLAAGGVDTFSTAATAVAPGVDTFSNAIAIGDEVITFADGSTLVVTTNVYEGDGTLTGDRIVDMGGNTITFNNGGPFIIDGKLTVTGLIDPTGVQFTDNVNQPDVSMPNTTIYVTDGSLSGIASSSIVFKDGAGNYHDLQAGADGRNVPILRGDSLEDVAPTGAEIPSPISGDSSIIQLSNGLHELWKFGVLWVKVFTIPVAVLGGSRKNLIRADALTGVQPSAGEITAPVDGDTAAVFLTDGTIEYWAHNGVGWALVNTVTPATLDGNDTHVLRADNFAGVQPSGAEVLAPQNGDTAKVLLADQTHEFWSHNGVSWTLDMSQTAAAANVRLFADDTTVAPAYPGNPTEAEIAAFAAGQVPNPYIDGPIWYTGTDSASDDATSTYWIDQAGDAQKLSVLGGLPQFGTITADPATAMKGVYDIDARGGAFVVTLPSATGSGDRIIFAEGVGSVIPVTITPQVSQTINGELTGVGVVIDVPFGQYQAIDVQAGQWVISGLTDPAPAHSVRYTDGAGLQKWVPMVSGANLTFNGSVPLWVAPTVASATARTVTLIPQNSYSNHGFLFGTSDNLLWRHGYSTTNQYINSPNNSTTYTPQPMAMIGTYPMTGTWVGIRNTSYNTIAWTSTGELWAMGYNQYGTVGRMPEQDPLQAYEMRRVGMISTEVVIDALLTDSDGGISTMYVLTASGKVFGCGYAGYGQLAQGNTTQQGLLVEITGFTGNAVQIACSDNHQAFLAIRTDAAVNNLWMCGYNGYGQLGDGSTTSRNNLVNIPETIRDVQCHGVHSSRGITRIITSAYHIKTAGYGSNGAIGNGFTSSVNTFTRESTGRNDWQSMYGIRDGDSHTVIAIDSQDMIWGWGDNGTGLLGHNDQTQRNTPTILTQNWGIGNIQKIIPTNHHDGGGFYVIAVNGDAFYAGFQDLTRNMSGSSDLGAATNSLVFERVPRPSNGARWVDMIGVGHLTDTHTHAVDEYGNLWAWGTRVNGTLGDGERTSGFTFNPTMVTVN